LSLQDSSLSKKDAETQEEGYSRHAIKLMDPDGRFARILLSHIDGLGFDLVKIQIHSTQGSRGPLLQILAEPKDRTKRMGVEDCRSLSKTLSAILDVEDVLSGRFVLEVSSPGIDRPLTKFNDFERFTGFNAKITIDPPADNGQKRFSGTISECEIDPDDSLNGQITLITDEEEELTFDFGRISKAGLVYSDALMEASKERIL
jgi:ribosome maturation factor RimP